jgi:hypothetical protein
MLNSYTRKQFFKKSFGQGLKALNRLLELCPLPTNKANNKFPDTFNDITSDFSPSFLKEEAQNLGLNIKSLDHEDILKAIHKAMEKQREPTENNRNEHNGPQARSE